MPSLEGRLVRAYRVNGRYEEARKQADQGLQLFPGFTDMIYE